MTGDRGALPVLHRILAVVRRAARPLGVLTATGRVLVVVAAVALAAGLGFGVAELDIVGVVALVVLLAAVPLSAGRPAFAVRIDLGDGRVVAGESAAGALVVENTGGRRSRPSDLEVPVGAAVGVLSVPSLAPGERYEPLFEIPTTRRGLIVVGPAVAAKGDPFGVVRRRSAWSTATTLHVHPLTVRVGGTADGLVRDLEGVETRARTTSDIAFHALRDYVPGDDRRAIHWRTTARSGQLMVREFEEVRRTHLAVALTTGGADFADDDEFELAVSIVGSLGRGALRGGQPVSVVAQGRSLETRTEGSLLDDLAGVERVGEGSTIGPVALQLRDAAPDASLAVVVVGGGATPEEIRRAARGLPRQGRRAAVLVERDAELEYRTIGDTAMVRVGRLSDLAASFRPIAA